MADPLPVLEDDEDFRVMAPDVSHLTTEDDQPMENVYQDKQCDILTEALRVSWPQGRPFISASDVAVFPEARDEVSIVPDVMLSVGVEPPGPCHQKEFRSYFIWNFGKPPDIAFEIVSNIKGGEDTQKLERYAKIRVPYYVIFDPEGYLSSRPLRIFQLTGMTYVEKLDRMFPEIGLGLTLWSGEFDGFQANWLRWVDPDNVLLPVGQEVRERADHEQARADNEQARADNERARADKAEEQAERLRQKLRELGVDCD